jgi:hypothetical protein
MSSGLSLLSVYAREILELHPVWRFRGTTGHGNDTGNAPKGAPGSAPGNTLQPYSETPAADALPLASERIYCWSVSLNGAPVSVAQREAMQRATALALAPAESLSAEPLSLHWEDHLLPVDAGKADAAPSGSGTEGALSLQALQRWLVSRMADPRSEAIPKVVLVWGAAFSGPVAVVDPAAALGPAGASGQTAAWLFGLPPPDHFATAAARRQTWADLLALRRELR